MFDANLVQWHYGLSDEETAELLAWKRDEHRTGNEKLLLRQMDREAKTAYCLAKVKADEEQRQLEETMTRIMRAQESIKRYEAEQKREEEKQRYMKYQTAIRVGRLEYERWLEEEWV